MFIIQAIRQALKDLAVLEILAKLNIIVKERIGIAIRQTLLSSIKLIILVTGQALQDFAILEIPVELKLK